MYKLIACLAIFLWCGSAFPQPEPTKDYCATDLSVPLEAYLCSQERLAAARPELEKVLSETILAFPKKAPDGLLVTRADIESSQAMWLSHIRKHCSLISALPGKAGDWHFPAANENFCELEEIKKRIDVLLKWKSCAIDGGGICLP